MKVMPMAATALGIIPHLAANLMPNYFLGNRQNAVEEADLRANGLVLSMAPSEHGLSRRILNLESYLGHLVVLEL